MDALNIGLVQTELAWESAAQNRSNIDDLLSAHKDQQLDLVILPEMFTTGFSMKPEQIAESMSGDSIAWMKAKAKQLNAALAGSLIIQDQDKFYNRFIFAHPNGQLDHYDKRHLFTLAGEHIPYTAGTQRKLIAYRGWKIFPQVCYDLRFPVFSRNDLDYELMIYVANWPKPRKEAWRTLLQARAIENQCYVAGVNRIGQDANDLIYEGNSAMIDFTGQRMIELERNTMEIIRISKSPMTKFREKLNFLADADQFIIKF